MIDGRTKLVAHIGYPTESFISPMIYNPFFEARKINAAVVPMGCKSEDYATFLKMVFRLSNLHGALITMPHKMATLALVDEASVSARIAGACNAVKLDERGQLIGDMFDGEGFVRGVQRKGPADRRGQCLCRWLRRRRQRDCGIHGKGRRFQARTVRRVRARHERTYEAPPVALSESRSDRGLSRSSRI
jgi:hypothetical protein